MAIIIVEQIARSITARQRQQIKDNMDIAIQIQESLHGLQNESRRRKDSIRELLATKFSLLDEINKIAFENVNQTIAKRKISDMVTNLIGEFRDNPDKIKELSQLIDLHYDNIFSKFKADFPEIKSADYNLFVLSVLGFSSQTIAAFLNEDKVTSIYYRKKRIKERIKSSESSYKEDYLLLLGVKP